jgi:hypothetical protein
LSTFSVKTSISLNKPVASLLSLDALPICSNSVFRILEISSISSEELFAAPISIKLPTVS